MSVPIAATAVSYHVEAHAVSAADATGEPTQLSHSHSHSHSRSSSFRNTPYGPGLREGITNETAAREYLSSQEWPKGLQDTFINNLSKVPVRFFVCDNSGSMCTNDGHVLMNVGGGKKRLVDCSRWTELTSALKFHATIAKEAGAPTEFHLLNNFDPVVIGTGDATADAAQWSKFLEILDESPGGETPLCKHIRVVVDKIRAVEQQLRANNQRACVIIASDGESTDGDIQQAMRPLKSLPVWVVVRLCTDEDRVVNYWNEIDNQLEVELDVLDDLQGEAQEVYAANPWLTYGEPLHRMREFGIPIKELDMLDSNLLSLEQLRKLCTVIFGGKLDDFPHPGVNWSLFLDVVKRENGKIQKPWSVTSNCQRDWINTSKLGYSYDKGGICTVS